MKSSRDVLKSRRKSFFIAKLQTILVRKKVAFDKFFFSIFVYELRRQSYKINFVLKLDEISHKVLDGVLP